jgi:glycosyltransferase involved in cell wall biosynthesis
MNSDVVFLTHTLEGGVGRVTTLLAEGFVKNGIAAEIWSSKKRMRSIFFDLLRYLNKTKPKTIISATHYMNVAAITISFFLKNPVKVVVVEHIAIKSDLASLNFIKRFVIRLLVSIFYRFADHIVTVSKESGDILSKYCFLPRGRIATIYNPVISEDIYEKSRREMDHPFFLSNTPVFLNVGRLDKQKDIPTLLYAFKKVLDEKDARLIVIGEGKEKEELHKIITDLSLESKVDLIGKIDNPYPFFKKSDVFVLSSLWEGLPTVLIEALALQLAIVSTNCPTGPTEILDNGTYGLLTPVKDPTALARAMLNLIEEPGLVKKANSEFLQRFTQDHAVKEYLTLIK